MPILPQGKKKKEQMSMRTYEDVGPPVALHRHTWREEE